MGVGATLGLTAFIVAATPFLLLSALLLIPIAIVTTALAACALSLRAFLVYLELFAAVVHNHFSAKLAPARRRAPKPASAAAALPRSRSVRSASSSSGSRTPRFEPPAVTPATPLTRDFEGVGGWRLPAEDDESEGQWLTMNSRLELPAVSSVAPEERSRHHHRHSSSGALLVGALKRPALRSRPNSVVLSGSASPEAAVAAGMSVSARVKSMVQLGEARWKAERRKSSSSSGSSGKTLVISGQM